VFLTLGLILSGCSSTETTTDSRENLEELQYRTDIAPIQSRFEYIKSINSVFWKGDIIGDATFGPTSYFIKAFITIDSDEATSLMRKYEFSPFELDFEPGISPEVTGYTQFAWTKNEEFTKDMLSYKFIGEVYFDSINGVIYLNVENL
jgi:hypothetical protein